MHRLALLLICALPHQDLVAPEWGRRIQWAASEGPVGREHSAFVADPARSRAVLVGGSGYAPYGSPLADAWAFDFAQESWSPLDLAGDELTPGGSRRSAAVAGGAFLHGGYAADFTELGELWRLTFEEQQIVVENLVQENQPPARQLHGFACDRAGERFAVFGGGDQNDLFDDTWIGHRTQAGVSWERFDSEEHPSARFGFAFAFDPEHGRLLVCGGELLPPDGSDEMVVARDLWALDFTSEQPAWTLLAEYDSSQFPGRRNPAFTFDERAGDLFVWGGTGDGATALPDLYVVRTRLEGAPVERIPQAAGIITRASSFGVIDDAGGRALLGFGNTRAGPFVDLAEVHLRKSTDEQQGTLLDK